VTLSPDALADLKARHLAFLEARLVSPEAEADWKQNLAHAYADLLAVKVRDVADARLIADAVDALISTEAVEAAVRPLARRVLAVVLRELSAERGTVAARVPVATRRRLDQLLERPGLFPDRLMRAMVEEDAVEEVMRDTLYDALKEFSEKVNPFVADWGLPALLKRLGPFGVGKGLEGMRADFDKRLDPEIRKFLQGFSRRGLKRMADLTIAKADEPRFVAVRKRLAGWILEQEIAELCRGVDAEAIALGQEIALDVAASELQRSSFRARRRVLVEEAIAAHLDRPLGEVLRELGVTLTLDFPAIGAATWPLVRAVVGLPAVSSYLARIVGEFYDAEMSRSAAASAGKTG
jgi:hypothetical protein